MRRNGISILLAAGLLVQGAALGVTLVQDGEPKAVVILAPGAGSVVTNAAQELTNFLTKISGGAVPLVKNGEAAPSGLLPVFLGSAADPALEAEIRKKGDGPDSFALSVRAGAVHIRGLSDEGTQFGVYDLLEQTGVRWFLPGEIGTVIPSNRTVTLAEQTTIQVPDFNARRLSGGAVKARDWAKHARLGGTYFPAAHGAHLPKKGYSFEEHPEFYALIGGERRNRQLCVSNPDVIKAVIDSTLAYCRANPQATLIGIGPNDGRGFCECASCTALDAGDWDPFAATVSMTDRYLWFFNQILDGLAAEFPDRKIGFYSYAAYNRPPLKVKPNPRIIPAFAPITLCRIHDLGNPICPEKHVYQRWLIQEWGKILPEVYDRGYWFNLADPGLSFPMVHRIRKQIPISKELGITGWRVETVASWVNESPSLYIAAKLMWNAGANIDALMRDFHEKFFGPAAAPMARHLTRLDTALRDGDFHTGSSYDIPNFFPPALRAQAKADLAEAVRLAGEGLYGRRVQLFTEGFDYTDAFCTMMEKRAAQDWKAARAALERMDAFREVLFKYEVPMISKEVAVSYLTRFFRPCTEQGYDRAAGKAGVLAAALGDEWQFQQDPDGLGEALAWFSVDLSGGNWRPLRTSTLSWSDQGLRYYKSTAWYRQSVPIDAAWKGKKLMLWFGGTDEKARVWVNGTLLGDSPGRALAPFELDATAAVRPGQLNQVTVWVSNKTLNEVGTGGITAPVFFYSPIDTNAPAADRKGEDLTPVEFR